MDISFIFNMYMDVYGHLILPVHSTYQKEKSQSIFLL